MAINKKKDIENENKQDEQKNLPLKMSNNLIQAKYNTTRQSQKLFELTVIKAVENDDGDMCCTLTADEIKSYMKLSGNSVYDMVRKAALPEKKKDDDSYRKNGSLLGMNVIAEDKKKKRFEAFPIFQYVSYDKGVFKVIFSKRVKPEIYQIQGDFTTMNARIPWSFSSLYSHRLYQILYSNIWRTQYKKNNQLSVTYELGELRGILGTFDTQNRDYIDAIVNRKMSWNEAAEKCVDHQVNKDWSRFRDKVLNVAVKEINNSELADMQVEFKAHSGGKGAKGKSITRVEFIITSKKHKYDMLDERYKEISLLMDGAPLKKEEVETLLEIANGDVEKIKKAYRIAQNTKKVNNLVAFMISAIKENWIGKAPVVKYREKDYEDSKKIDELINLAMEESQAVINCSEEERKNSEPEYMQMEMDIGYDNDEATEQGVIKIQNNKKGKENETIEVVKEENAEEVRIDLKALSPEQIMQLKNVGLIK